MLKPNCKYLRGVTAILLSASITVPTLAQDKEKKDSKATGQPGESEMMAMMTEMAKLGENHKLLGHGVGTWAYTVKMWMNPSAAPSESSGSAVVKPIMDGRYLVSDHIGKMQMPGPDGKMTDLEFKGMAIEGYDNAKKKFVSSWVDNMGTGIMNSEGTYDAANKTFNYHAEYEPMPGMKTKIREVIKIIDNDHHTFEFFEDRGGTEVRIMEITYTRKS